MKKPVVFSLVREQSVFMTAIISLLTFLSVLALGVALAMGTAVVKWNTQWDLFATVQVMESDNATRVEKIIKENKDKIATTTEITTEQMQNLMRPWISGGGVLKNYLPKMYEIKFNTKSDLQSVGAAIKPHARFLTHANAMHSATSAGWKMVLIAGFVLMLTLGAIGVCITYIAQNTAMLHRRELEILNQVGATDSFVARQMQIITAKICGAAAAIGFVTALPMLALIMSAAHSGRVGLMSMMGITGAGWLILLLLPVIIVGLAIIITRRTTIKLLQDS